MNEELCRRIAPLFCQADNIALGSMVLPVFGRGEHPAAVPLFRGRPLAARACRDGDSLVINGENLRPLNSGSDALLFGLLCALEGEEEPALILVPGDSPGLIRGERFLKTGLAASANADINMTEVRVPAENLVFCGENRLKQMLSWLYLCVGAVTVGSLFAAFEIIREWRNTRVIKGKGNLLKENPLTASLMGEISHEILISRLLLHQLAKMFSRTDPDQHALEERLFIPALSVVSHITQAAEKAINQSMELMGSAGYATEWNLERYWRDVRQCRSTWAAGSLIKWNWPVIFSNPGACNEREAFGVCARSMILPDPKNIFPRSMIISAGSSGSGQRKRLSHFAAGMMKTGRNID